MSVRSRTARLALLSRGIDAVLRELRRVHRRSGELLDAAEDFVAEARGEALFIAAPVHTHCHRCNTPCGSWQCWDCGVEAEERRAN